MSLTSAQSMLASGTFLRVLEPGSPHARSIVDLAFLTTLILGGIFVIVAGVIVYALMRFRGREGEPDPQQFAGSRRLELIWTAIPCGIVLLLFVLTARTMTLADPPPPPEPDLIITGHQWWWEVRYTGSGVIAADEIHLPVGRPLSIRLESADVIHEFWVPQLARKISNVPGHPNHLWLQADEPGTFLGACSEFCGAQHAWMRLLVIAEPRAEFEAWQQAQLRPAVTPVSDAARKGQALFMQSTCVNCHSIRGTTAHGTAAPDLTHFASRRTLGSGVAANTPDNLRRWLADPQRLKPGVKMPDYKFSEEQLTQLVAYFETLQ